MLILLFGPKKLSCINQGNGLTLDGCSVKSLLSFKNLGVIIDSNLCKTAFQS